MNISQEMPVAPAAPTPAAATPAPQPADETPRLSDLLRRQSPTPDASLRRARVAGRRSAVPAPAAPRPDTHSTRFCRAASRFAAPAAADRARSGAQHVGGTARPAKPAARAARRRSDARATRAARRAAAPDRIAGVRQAHR
ncbi:MAG: hypothetical protein U0521_00090 [Anaerolineae bacterium]